jgi:effector-binding domain-containing protein
MPEPHITTRQEQPYVAIRVQVPMDKLGEVVPPLTAEVFEWLGQRGIAPGAPPFWKYNVIDMERGLEIETGVTVPEPVDGDGRVVAGVLPAGRYATLHHTGAPDTLMAATGDLLNWAGQAGLTFDTAPDPAGERWGCRLEIYLTDPREEPDLSKWETLLAFRLKDQED